MPSLSMKHPSTVSSVHTVGEHHANSKDTDVAAWEAPAYIGTVLALLRSDNSQRLNSATKNTLNSSQFSSIASKETHTSATTSIPASWLCSVDVLMMEQPDTPRPATAVVDYIEEALHSIGATHRTSPSLLTDTDIADECGSCATTATTVDGSVSPFTPCALPRAAGSMFRKGQNRVVFCAPQRRRSCTTCASVYTDSVATDTTVTSDFATAVASKGVGVGKGYPTAARRSLLRPSQGRVWKLVASQWKHPPGMGRSLTSPVHSVHTEEWGVSTAASSEAGNVGFGTLSSLCAESLSSVVEEDLQCDDPGEEEDP